MNTILVATDFSKTASNAVDYAVEVAKSFKAKIILFHAYNMPVIPSEVPIILPIDELDKNAMNGLKQVEKSIHEKYNNSILTECFCSSGFPADEINKYVSRHSIDLIVMGMDGAGFLAEKFIGSTTTSLFKMSKCPVLVIPHDVKFKKPDHIVLACDYSEIPNKMLLDPLKVWMNCFQSKLHVLNVIEEGNENPTVSNAIAGVKLEHALEEVNHTFHFEKNNNVVDGINNFINKNQVDMVAMLPHKHSLLQSIFVGSQTKHFAFHSHVPLLVIHT